MELQGSPIMQGDCYDNDLWLEPYNGGSGGPRICDMEYIATRYQPIVQCDGDVVTVDWNC
jgi:hypothetical protein